MYQEGRVLISGMQGLGAEIAKILLIGGFDIVLHDEKQVDTWDLSGCFLFSESDMGFNRAVVSARKLHMMIESGQVSYLDGRLTYDQLAGFKVVIVTDMDLEEALDLSEYCHNYKPSIKFIRAQVSGVSGCVFTDFGRGSYFYEIGQQLQDDGKEYKPLRDGMAEFESFDGADKLKALYLAFKTLDMYKAQNCGLRNPKLGEDIREFVALAWNVNQTWGEKGFKELDEEMLLSFASCANVVFIPMAAFIGSVVGQQVLSHEMASSRLQFFLFQSDVLTCLNNRVPDCLNVELTVDPSMWRYTPQVSMFGSTLQEKIMEAKVVIMGFGSVGCEILKNLALLGVGKVEIFYEDCEAEENTFCKGEDAVACAKQMNPSIMVSIIKDMNLVEFIDHYWDETDVVISTLDKGRTIECNMQSVHWVKPFIIAGAGKSGGFVGSIFVPNITSVPFLYSVHHLIACRQLMLEASYSKQDNVDVLFNKFFYEEERSDSLELYYSFDDCFLWASQRYRELFPVQDIMSSADVERDHLLLLLCLAKIRAHDRGAAIPPWAQDEQTCGIRLASIYEVDSSNPMATSSTAIAGLICIELLKLLSGVCKLEDYCTYEGNMSAYMLKIAMPFPVFEENNQESSWTEWDYRWVAEETTLRTFFKHLLSIGLRVRYILCGSKLIYSIMVPMHEERVNMSFGEILCKFLPDTLEQNYAALVVCCRNDDYKVVCLPTILIELLH